MGLYDALTKADLIEGMAKAPDQKKGVPNHAKTLNKMLIEGTTWEQIDIFLSTCTTKQFTGGWPKIKGHLNFCRQGKNNNGKRNTWVFNVGDKTDEFVDNCDRNAVIRLVGFSNGVILEKTDGKMTANHRLEPTRIRVVRHDRSPRRPLERDSAMTQQEIWLRDTLATHGRKLFNTPGPYIHPFTNDPRADALAKDLHHYPHAFVLACIMDQQYKSELVWAIPYQFQQKLGGDFLMDRLKRLSAAEITTMMTSPVPLHRFATRIAGYFYDGVQRISRQYGDDASRIWCGRPRCAEVLARFREFRGVGQKIAHMAVNCLARELKVPLADYIAIDISADVHVLRVFGRLGLTAEGASRDEVIMRARQLNPEFPGLLDYPAWEIGRNWCRPDRPQCSACYMSQGCATAKRKYH